MSLSAESYLLRNGTVYFPEEKTLRKADIIIENGSINRIQESIQPQEGIQIIEADGKIITPGFTDLHTHLREPGREDAETLESGAMAALAGGFTTICAMPNTEPATDSREQADFIRNKSKALGLAEILPIGSATKGRRGEEISEYALLKEGGVVALSDDGDWIRSAEVMRHALEYAGMLGLPVITHAEEPTLCEGGVMNEGKVSTILGLKTRPPVAEEIALKRDIALAAYTESHLHVAHLTTGTGVALIEEAKSKGIRVTAEVTPHHLLLADESMFSFDANLKVNPPLRTEQDRKSLLKAITEGLIDAIATDHAPHPVEEKEQELDIAPSGMIGLQTAFSLLWENLVDKSILKPETLLGLLTTGPASVIGRKVELREGLIVNLVLFDPEARWVLDNSTNRSRSRNTPWFGKTLKGKVEAVFLADKKFSF